MMICVITISQSYFKVMYGTDDLYFKYCFDNFTVNDLLQKCLFKHTVQYFLFTTNYITFRTLKYIFIVGFKIFVLRKLISPFISFRIYIFNSIQLHMRQPKKEKERKIEKKERNSILTRALARQSSSIPTMLLETQNFL